jgi:hypothetical protein
MQIVDLEEMGQRLDERKRELGLTEADFVRARNNSSRRTPEKRALLRRLAEESERSGRPLRFPANF